jgi:hypothetical protein
MTFHGGDDLGDPVRGTEAARDLRQRIVGGAEAECLQRTCGRERGRWRRAYGLDGLGLS